MSKKLEDFTLLYPKMRVSRFALTAGETIPLHIHSKQFGLVYLLQGKCILTTHNVTKVNTRNFALTLDSKQTLFANTY